MGWATSRVAMPISATMALSGVMGSLPLLGDHYRGRGARQKVGHLRIERVRQKALKEDAWKFAAAINGTHGLRMPGIERAPQHS
jgi:hypothetical protein